MSYPFSGILVRFLSKNHDDSSASEIQVNASERTDEKRALSKAEEKAKFLATILPDELHINIWEIGNNPVSPFIDVGVIVGNRANTSHVVVDLPWPVEAKDVFDLGSRLNGEKSVAAIFNEVVHYDGFAEGNYANISFRKNDKDVKPFSLLRLNSQDFDVRQHYLSDSTIATSRLTITIPPQLPDVDPDNVRKSAYIRFRIRRVPVKVYTSVFERKDKSLISSTVETRIVDFRINVRRGIPEGLLSSDHNLRFPEFDKIHCFLTTERSEECVSQSQSYAGYRSLMDEDVWNEYVRVDNSEGISSANSVRNYLGYQWTVSAKKSTDGSIKKVKDLIVLARFSKVKSDQFSNLRFLLLVVFLGATGSGLWDVAKVIHESGNVGGRLIFFVVFGITLFAVINFIRKKSAGLWQKFTSYVKKVFK
ncbi:hypothetical protein LOY57_26010 [Pseudomonas moraviensis]|uniref:hypothetical protein n=1 Tax=Pseudomonas moraviensis TaxID=321662 RepID=UPI0020931574|nr:hypothetical protein [Pseudomonas moraviensis]UST64023.1 hypothetical protein NF673_26025 [Pseudomonas moraviensis]UVL46081.1 hypothetical protein LOY57_26010 [Pseudomonas moraviensis]